MEKIRVVSARQQSSNSNLLNSHGTDKCSKRFISARLRTDESHFTNL